MIAGLGRSPGEGNGNPPQYSCLGNPMDRSAWQAIVHGVAELDVTAYVHMCTATSEKESVIPVFGMTFPSRETSSILPIVFLFRPSAALILKADDSDLHFYWPM